MSAGQAPTPPQWHHVLVLAGSQGRWVRMGCGWLNRRPGSVPVVMLVQAVCDHPATATGPVVQERVAS